MSPGRLTVVGMMNLRYGGTTVRAGAVRAALAGVLLRSRLGEAPVARVERFVWGRAGVPRTHLSVTIHGLNRKLAQLGYPRRVSRDGDLVLFV
jgi:hypothetical protein